MKCTVMATCLVVTHMSILGIHSALAQANFFVPPGGVGSWSDTANWTEGHLPQGAESALVHAGREATIDIANPNSFAFLRIADNDVSAVDGTLHVQAGAELHVTGQILLAAGGPSDNKGVIDQTGGDILVDDALFIGYDAPHTGVYNISDGTLTAGNLWFRFGNGTLTQTGGVVDVQQLVLAEGGNPFTSSLYDLQSGEFNVTGAANIGKAPGAGDPFAGSSLGSMNISGGIATIGELLFGTDPTDQVHMSGNGILRVRQATYTEADALADIASSKITGSDLIVSTINIGNGPYTQIAAVPEPNTFASSALALWAMALRRRRSAR